MIFWLRLRYTLSMLDKTYDPKAVEDAIYKRWEDSGAFKPESCPVDGEPFTISMPPPNATGQLHLGHAARMSTEDIFARFARMQGKKTLWVPGTDHAAIATENVVIKQLKDGGMRDPRKELGRDKLVAKIAEFVEQSKRIIRSQIRKMGASCDWTRERYTFEPGLNRCVNEVFCTMKNDGLIYRGHRIVNWDPKLQTTVSDDEVVYKEETTALYTFQYGPFQMATARPETKFGDHYVVMHPDDKRYKKFKHGETFDCEWINGSVKATVIKDEAIDPEFGTGVMTITPWHDHIDFEIAERHGLEKEQIIDEQGKLLPIAGEFAGMKIDAARPLIVEKLQAKGLLVKVDENYIHNKAVSQRGGGVLEPQIKLQWFIDVNKPVVDWKKKKMSLKEIMHDAVHHGDITIIPDRFGKTYFHWIDHLRDWCISRQIWWGHRIPVYYCLKCVAAKDTQEKMKNVKCKMQNGVIVSVETVEKCPQCGSTVEQDPDTLDTWFSSAMWTWSTLVDPALTSDMSLSLQEILKRSPDFQTFHPTTVMETAYDILFFWVARMILMTTYAIGDIPFKTVYLSGLIRTRDGRKMSKSDPETAIDPLEIVAEYGADALRLSMIVGQSAGNDTRLYKEKIAGYRNFINKLWNAARFVLLQCEQAGIDPTSISTLPDVSSLSLADRAVLHASEVLIEDVTKGLEAYSLSEVGERIYSFVWDYYCDWYLELSKETAQPSPAAAGLRPAGNCAVLVHVLRRILKLLHPYCPFVTEELWSQMKPQSAVLLISETWPKVKKERKDQAAFDDLQRVIDVISAIRKLRTDQNVEPGKEITVTLVSRKHCALLESEQANIRRMCKVKSLTIETDRKKRINVGSAFLTEIEVHLSLEGLIDEEKQKESLLKEERQLTAFAAGIEAKLGNSQFISKAPPALVEEQKARLAETKEKMKKIEERLRL